MWGHRAGEVPGAAFDPVERLRRRPHARVLGRSGRRRFARRRRLLRRLRRLAARSLRLRRVTPSRGFGSRWPLAFCALGAGTLRVLTRALWRLDRSVDAAVLLLGLVAQRSPILKARAAPLLDVLQRLELIEPRARA